MKRKLFTLWVIILAYGCYILYIHDYPNQWWDHWQEDLGDEDAIVEEIRMFYQIGLKSLFGFLFISTVIYTIIYLS